MEWNDFEVPTWEHRPICVYTGAFCEEFTGEVLFQYHWCLDYPFADTLSPDEGLACVSVGQNQRIGATEWCDAELLKQIRDIGSVGSAA